MKQEFLQLWFQWLQKKLLAPFSNKVTTVLLVTGAALVATPLLEHLIINVVLKKVFDIDLGISVPDTKAYITGGTLLAIAALHNLGIQYLQQSKPKSIDVTDTDLPFEQRTWRQIQDIYSMLRFLPDRYLSTDFELNDVNLSKKLSLKFSEFEKYYLNNKPFHDQELINELGELLDMMRLEVESFGGLISRRRRGKDFGDYDRNQARSETKLNVASILRKIQAIEPLLK